MISAFVCADHRRVVGQRFSVAGPEIDIAQTPCPV